MPLHHPQGRAQVEVDEAVVEVRGRREKVAFLCVILHHSDVSFVKAYPRETAEAFLDGHVSAFAFLGGVPRSVLYDNTTLTVTRILGVVRRGVVTPQIGTNSIGCRADRRQTGTPNNRYPQMPNLKAAHREADPRMQESGKNTGKFQGCWYRVSRALSVLANDRRALGIEAARGSDER